MPKHFLILSTCRPTVVGSAVGSRGTPRPPGGSRGRAQQPEHDLLLALLAVPVVAEGGQRAEPPGAPGSSSSRRTGSGWRPGGAGWRGWSRSSAGGPAASRAWQASRCPRRVPGPAGRRGWSRRCRMRSSPSWRQVPRTAATWPWAQERSGSRCAGAGKRPGRQGRPAGRCGSRRRPQAGAWRGWPGSSCECACLRAVPRGAGWRACWLGWG